MLELVGVSCQPVRILTIGVLLSLLLVFELVHDLVFSLVSVFDQVVDSFHQMTEGLLLLRELLLNSVEVRHQGAELCILDSVVNLLP